MRPLLKFFLFVPLLLTVVPARGQNTRPFKNETDERIWLENMVWHHQYTMDEISAATGLETERIKALVSKYKLSPETKPRREQGAPLLVVPYPGGRHPRIGFLDGAVEPQRETKLSIFTPWDDSSYVVADVPEAIWSNLGLTYLAHTHVPTIWSTEKIQLPKLEWAKLENGDLRMERTLPNGIRFGTLARCMPEVVLIKMWLSNGTTAVLTDLRVQNCVMLKGTKGFNAQTNTNKVMRGAFSACRSETGDRWVITAWKPLHRVWANEPVPCLHSDPKFPDTAPGAMSVIHGLVSFYTGREIELEFRRLDQKWEDWMRFSPGPVSR